MNIDINTLEMIRADLDDLGEDDALFIDENGKTKYAIMPIDKFDRAEELMALMDGMEGTAPKVKVIGSNEDLSYEEYERIKAIVMEAVEKTFKPKAEKLN